MAAEKSTEKKAEKNIYVKLQEMRVELQGRELKKSGHNDHKNYDYFELGDFLPAINEIQKEYNTITLFDINKEKARLTLVDCGNTEQLIAFEMPIAELSIAGANSMQNIGGLTTYARRYLYMIAFEIAENDEFDNTVHEPQPSPETILVDAVKIKVLKGIMEKKGVKEEQILDRYKVGSFEELTVMDFMKACNGLEKMPDVESKQVDLGL